MTRPWADVKGFLSENPETAKKLQEVAKDPNAMRGFLQTQAIANHYSKKMEMEDGPLKDKMKAMEHDPELAPIFEAVKKDGLPALMQYMHNEELMLKFSAKMGGLPAELQASMAELEQKPLTIHEAAKMGDLKAVQEYVEKQLPLDVQDSKGITPLGYAIGANRIAVARMLMDKRANPFAVDSKGNSGLHYAAGYGRPELCEYLLKKGCSHSQQNSDGQTPLALARGNKQEATVQVLTTAGAQ